VTILLKIIVYAASLWVAVEFVDGLEFVGDWVAFALIAAILAAVNVFVKPVVRALSLPFIILTLGLFLLLVNWLVLAITVWVSETLRLGLTSDGFGPTLWGGLVVAIVSWIGEALLDRK
jgi:putative membrane protein